MMQPIPFLDLKRQYSQLKSKFLRVAEEIFDSNAFSGGPYTEEFEKNFAAYCESEFAVGVNSGTSALHLALIAAGIREGDEVIVPANTFIATAWAVSYVGATPVFVDCDSETWQISPQSVMKKVTAKTKAIIGVHLYGQVFDINAMLEIANTHKLILIEDCAQSHGARYHQKRVGTFGRMGCFSFYPGKNLGAFGEAGAVVTNNRNDSDALRVLRNHGSSVRYHHDVIGYNMRMDGVQAGILNVKLSHLDQWNSKRREIADRYLSEISNSAVKFQKVYGNTESVYHLFVITVDDREKMIAHLNTLQIFPGLHYPVPCHLQKAYSVLNYKAGDLPHSEYLAGHCLSLPMFAELTNDEVSRVIDAVNKYSG